MSTTPSTTILLIRHAQTDWNIARRWQGHLDIPLNEVGRVQAEALADRLATWPLSAVYSSDLKRAADTASIVAKSHELKPILDKGLRERHGGHFQGQTLEELEAEHGEFWYEVRFEGAPPPGGESNLEVARRVTRFFKRIRTDHQGEMVALVSHGGALNALIAYILGLPLGSRAPISLRGNTGLSIVEIKDARPRLTLLNDVSHLPNGNPFFRT